MIVSSPWAWTRLPSAPRRLPPGTQELGEAAGLPSPDSDTSGSDPVCSRVIVDAGDERDAAAPAAREPAPRVTSSLGSCL